LKVTRPPSASARRPADFSELDFAHGGDEEAPVEVAWERNEAERGETEPTRFS